MKNSSAIRNVKVLAVNNGHKNGFNILLDFSGRKEFVMYHRHNAFLYKLLCTGIYLEDLRRWKPRKTNRQANRKLVNTLSHALKVIESYLAEYQHVY